MLSLNKQQGEFILEPAELLIGGDELDVQVHRRARDHRVRDLQSMPLSDADGEILHGGIELHQGALLQEGMDELLVLPAEACLRQ